MKPWYPLEIILSGSDNQAITMKQLDQTKIIKTNSQTKTVSIYSENYHQTKQSKKTKKKEKSIK